MVPLSMRVMGRFAALHGRDEHRERDRPRRDVGHRRTRSGVISACRHMRSGSPAQPPEVGAAGGERGRARSPGAGPCRPQGNRAGEEGPGCSGRCRTPFRLLSGEEASRFRGSSLRVATLVSVPRPRVAQAGELRATHAWQDALQRASGRRDSWSRPGGGPRSPGRGTRPAGRGSSRHTSPRPANDQLRGLQHHQHHPADQPDRHRVAAAAVSRRTSARQQPVHGQGAKP